MTQADGVQALSAGKSLDYSCDYGFEILEGPTGRVYSFLQSNKIKLSKESGYFRMLDGIKAYGWPDIANLNPTK
jgi:hypothetical protein